MYVILVHIYNDSATEQNIAQIILWNCHPGNIILFIYTIKFNLIDETESISNAYPISLGIIW